MNLHAIASRAIGSVNPPVIGQWLRATGTITAPSGKRAPVYAQAVDVPMQVQALSSGEVEHLDALNIQGVNRGVYLFGDVRAAQRVDAAGGDLLRFGGRTWLVVAALETWPGWCKVAVREQLDGA